MCAAASACDAATQQLAVKPEGGWPQGFFRRQRGQVFAQFYMPQFFPAAGATQSWALVPGCGHNDACMFNSTQFAAAWRGSDRGSA